MIELKQKDFKEIIKNTKKPIIIDFWAEWCMPCKILKPIINELELEKNKEIEFYSVEVDKNPDIANYFSIFNIPTLLFIKDGKILESSTGTKSKKTIEQKIQENFNG